MSPLLAAMAAAGLGAHHAPVVAQEAALEDILVVGSRIKRVDELSGGKLQWTDGMLYPVLHRLERNGLVEASWGRSDTGRRRKYYRLTEQGAGELESQRRQWEVVNETLRATPFQSFQLLPQGI